MTLVPAVLVLIVGSELIRTSIDRWFNAPMDEILSSANQIAGDYYQERQMLVERPGRPHGARARRRSTSTSADVAPLRDLLAPDVTLQRVQMVEVYRVGAGGGRCRGSSRCVDVAAPALPPGYSRAAADRLAAQALAGAGRDAVDRDARRAAAICCTPRPSSAARDGRATGVVVATDYLTGELAARSRRMTAGVRELQPAARAASGR